MGVTSGCSKYGISYIEQQRRIILINILIIFIVFIIFHNVGVDWESSPMDDKPPIPCPVLRAELDGAEYELFNEMHSDSFRGIKEGMDVPIKINPKNPDDYYIIEVLTPPRFCLVVGLIMIAFGTAAWFYFYGR